MASVELAQAYISLIPSAAGITDKLSQEMGAPLTAAATKSGNDSGAAFAKAIKGFVGPAIVAGGIAGLAAIGGSFDEAFDTIRVGTGKTGDELAGLKDVFKDVVSSVPASFGDASTAVTELSRGMGLSGDELDFLAKQVLNLSHITGTDLAGNVKAVSGVFNSWGDAVKSPLRGTDELFRVSQQTGISVADLATQMTEGGVVLRQSGFTFEESASMLGLLAKNGLSASDVMPALAKSMAVAAKEGRPAQEVFQETFTDIKNSTSDVEAAGMAISLFGAKAGPKFAALIREGKLSYEEMSKAIAAGGDTISGATKDTADWQEKLTLLKNKAMVALAPVAAKVFGAIGKAIDAIKPTWNWLQDHKPILIGVAIALGSVLVAALVALTTAAWAALVPVLAFIAPFVAVGVAIGALVAAVIWAYQNLGWFKAAVDAVKDALLWVWHNVLEPVIKWLSGHFVDLLKVVGEVMLAALTGGISEIIMHWGEILDFFKELPGKILGFFSGVATWLLDVGKKILQGMLDGIIWIAENVLYQWFIGIPLKILGWVATAATWLFGIGKKILQGLLDGIIWIAENVLYQYFIGIPLKILEWVGGAELWLLDKGKDIAMGLLRGLWNGIETVTNFFITLPSKIVGWLGNGLVVLKEWGGDLIKGIWEGMKASWNWVAAQWNKTIGAVRFEVPSWVPVVGGKGFDVPNLPTLANGAIDFAGGLAIVGERGPEIVNLPRGSDVFPNGTVPMNGASPINVTINTVMGNPQEIMRVLQPVLRTYQRARS